MIVRTYGRRNRSLSTGYEDTESEGFGEPFSQESPQDIYSFNFSSQDSHWSFDSEPFGGNSSQEVRDLEAVPARKHRLGVDPADGGRKLKKARNEKRDMELPRKGKSDGAKPVPVVAAPALNGTATLMETQEFGEMMEHVDEVNFALDGLRKAQPHRIRRASLLALLSICGTAQQRRLLRTHGMAKSIIDAVLGLNFDDSPSNLAAAALFYVLTTDGQDDNLLDSPSCIHFLIKLLKPITSDINKNRSISCKLLSLRKDINPLKDSGNGLDSTSNAIMVKVHEILVSCKEMKSTDGDDAAIGKKPELSPKWIALLTMEKACLTTISLEDTSGTVRRTGGNFKEKLRELGGLNAVFEVAQNCHSIMERWLEQSEVSSKDKMGVESLLLILKCLKVMENATFLSNDNQCHLLEMEGTRNYQGSPQSFTSLILSLIKILSGIFLSYKSSSCNSGEEVCNLSAGTDPALLADRKVERDDIISISSTEYSSREGTSSQKSFSISQNSQWLSGSVSGISKSTPETTSSHAVKLNFSKTRANSSTSESCSRTSRVSCGKNINTIASRMTSGLGKRGQDPFAFHEDTVDLTEDSEDPFAFHEDELKPSKWDVLSGRPRPRETINIGGLTIDLDIDEGCPSQPTSSQQGSCNPEKNHASDVATRSLDEETSSLLAECLLTAVKALMNLTNDNPVGCRQIATCGGLEILSSLIAGHFPSFSLSILEVDLPNDKNLSDQELDLLVAILGLLCNLVEKDAQNRSRLARASVPLESVKGAEGVEHKDVISLLCSIFLANQGAGEAAEEGKVLTWDDEAALLQGEKEAEKMIVEAYSALLLALLSTESKRTRNAIAEYFPDHSLKVLVPVLERFVEFHMTLNMISPETHTTVLEVIESCRIP